MKLSLLCEGLINEAGYARVISFNYNVVGPRGPNVDKHPTVLVLGKWKNPKTGNTLLGGINLNYLDRYRLDVALDREEDEFEREQKIMELEDALETCKGRQCAKIKRELEILRNKDRERSELALNLRKVLSPDKNLYNRYWRARRYIPDIIKKAYRTWNVKEMSGEIEKTTMKFKKEARKKRETDDPYAGAGGDEAGLM